MPILGQPPLGNVQVGQNFDPGHQGLMDRGGQRDVIHHRTVQTHPHAGLVLKGLDVNVAHAGGDGAVQQAV